MKKILFIDRDGTLIRTFITPTNLLPRNSAGVPNFASDTNNTAGKRTNRGFEGLAISPDGQFAFAMLQNGTVDDGWTSSARGLSHVVQNNRRHRPRRLQRPLGRRPLYPRRA